MSYVINHKIVGIILSVLLSSSYGVCADEYHLVTQAKKHLDTWNKINKSVLDLPSSDVATFFIKCLSVVLNANFLGLNEDVLIKTCKEQDFHEECQIAGYLAHRFNWSKLQKAIYAHYPSMYFKSMNAPDEVKNYVNEHFQALQNINITLQKVSDDKQFMMAFLALLMCEKKKQMGASDWVLLHEFERVFADETEVNVRSLINMFGWKGVLSTMDKKSTLATDEYLIKWRASKGKVLADQRPLFFRTIALKELITYARAHRCLYALIPIKDETKMLNDTDTPSNRILTLSNQYLNSLDGIQNIPSCAQWKEININNNFIKTVPSMDIFVNLCRLSLSNNRLTTFPVLLKSLKKLKYLELCDNQIKDIPVDAQEGFQELETLILAGNAIIELPSQLCFKKLIDLDVSDNEIKKMPESVGMQLGCLKVKDNPIAQDVLSLWQIENTINKARKDGNAFHIIW